MPSSEHARQFLSLVAVTLNSEKNLKVSLRPKISQNRIFVFYIHRKILVVLFFTKAAEKEGLELFHIISSCL